MCVRDCEGARCLKMGVGRGGVHEKPDLLEAFHESADAQVWRQILGSSLSQKKMNLGLAEMQFPAVLRGLFAVFSLFLVDILPRSQLLSPPCLHYF